MESEPKVSPETENEMRARFFEQVLDDLETRTENWQIVMAPLGDSMGYRVEVHATDGAQTVFVAGASNRSSLAAGSQAVARFMTVIEDALSEQTSEEIDTD